MPSLPKIMKITSEVISGKPLICDVNPQEDSGLYVLLVNSNMKRDIKLNNESSVTPRSGRSAAITKVK
jgi:hypothetical protein